MRNKHNNNNNNNATSGKGEIETSAIAATASNKCCLHVASSFVLFVPLLPSCASLSLLFFLFFFLLLSVDRPDLDLTAVATTLTQGITNLYGSPPSIDFYVAGQSVTSSPSAALKALMAANTDIVSFPIAASAVVPIYNLPSLASSTPLLLSRPVRTTQHQAPRHKPNTNTNSIIDTITHNLKQTLEETCVDFVRHR